MEPLAENWPALSAEVLRPVHIFSRHPWLLARFGLSALPSANSLTGFLFREERTKALFAGLAAHSFLSLDEPLSAGFGVLLGAAAHAVGWPIPRGGAQSITNALCTHLANLGGKIKTSSRVDRLRDLAQFDVTMCDVTPKQLLRMAGHRLSASYQRQLEKFRNGPGAFKVDYALTNPIPWKARECFRAATVHLGGSASEITASEAAIRRGENAERPFVLLAQPSLFDVTRAPQGKHTVWAYCHVPYGSKVDVLQSLERQIERFAPGFRDTVLARRVLSPAALEAMDANLIGGDIGGGALDVRQFLFRPTWRHYATSARDLYICSSSTPPGAGVHGMCGYHAARSAISRLGR
jgi:phytoene dehydrogenase-like protein